jgi:predicted nucleotidyltransferase
MKIRKNPDLKLLKKLVSIIVPLVHPKRIILFGSAARGEMKDHSDLDVLVVVRNGTKRNRACDRIHLSLWGFGFPKDIVVVTEGDVALHAGNPYTFIHSALKDGKELYRAA